MNQFLTVEQAASVLQCSKSFLDKARVYGNGPHFHRIGRYIRYTQKDIEDWMAENRQRTTSDQPKKTAQ